VITRRKVLQGLAGFLATTVGFSGYAFGIEPLLRMNVTRYRITPARWREGLHLRVAILADLHACEPWMAPERLAEIAAATNALSPDVILLLGDYVAAHRFVRRRVPDEVWAEALAQCRAPLGVHAILGNHDWWDDHRAQRTGKGPIAARRALERFAIPVYENTAVRLTKAGRPFWLAGLGDQLALFRRGTGRKLQLRGVDDLPRTLAAVTDEAPVILMAHEPDVFPKVPDRVSLTLSGHTHGGQVRLFGYAPVVPSRFGNRYAYGHIVENGRHLVVSGGLGCSIAPIRFGMPPEIVLLELGGAPEAVS
jgi:predicted MPP superfamily phosphohydrolase